MSRDRYSRRLECPDCNKMGKANIVENDGWSFVKGGSERRVESVSQGFTVINHGRDNTEETAVRCECGADAEFGLS